MTNSPDFKITYASGVFGGLHGSEGTMIFFLDRPTPTMIDGKDMEMSHIQRELQMELHLPYDVFMTVYNWMKEHIDRVNKVNEIK